MQTIAAVGPQALTVNDYIATLRRAMGRRPALVASLTPSLLRAAYRFFRSGWLDPITLELLKRSQPICADNFMDIVGRPLIAPAAFIAKQDGWPQSLWLTCYLNLLALSIAVLWIVTGIVSLGVFPIEESLDLLGRSGFGTPLGLPLLYFASVLDIALGITILTARKHRRLLWLFQGAIVLGYTAIISWRLPEFWMHPYGPILKNLPILAAMGLLYSQEPRG